MDWRAWLSKSSLHPSLTDEYSHLFSSNLLGEDDVEQLDHELLLSMGISVGKHRLEILKLARKERKGISSVIKKFRKCVANYILMLARSSSSALVAVPKAAGGQWWAGTVTNRRRHVPAKFKKKLMIANGSTVVRDCGEGAGANAEVRWDSMFQDLMPT